jgi:ABC-type branched-subunit amino acid transport system ATPase component
MGEVSLECRDLAKSFGGIRAVDNVNISFEAGKVTALMGPNGAGKTTIFHLITGLLRPDSGAILYRNYNLGKLRPWNVAQLGIGRVFQDIRIFKRLSVLENVLVAFRNTQLEKPLTAIFARRMIRDKEEDHKREILRWLELVDLLEHRNTPAEELSYGQQKLLAIVRLLAAGADVFLLDEPTAGVNPVVVSRLLKLIRNLAEQGKTVVVIEHNMSAVLEVAQWAYFMEEGQVTAFGLPQEILGNDSIRARYLGL